MQQRESLHERVYKDILLRIYEGEISVNTAFPTLEELCKFYQVGDKCARRVMVRLSENGYISTARGRAARVLFSPKQLELKETLPLEISCDKKALYSFYKAMRILFPSIYTYASMHCTQEHLDELECIIPSPLSYNNHCSDYVELNIRFFKTILSVIQNPMIIYIVKTVMRSTVLPAALMQQKFGQLEKEFIQSAAEMSGIYAAILAKDEITMKKHWKKLFEITDGMTKKAAESCRDVTAQTEEQAGLQFVSEYKYVLIAQDIYQKILDGKYTVGGALPSICEAQQTYGAGKVTVRAAYRLLSGFGIAETINGRGTRVISSYINAQAPFDEETMVRKKAEYLEVIELFRMVCGDIMRNLDNFSLKKLREKLEGSSNTLHLHSGVILFKSFMNGTSSPAVGVIFKAISGRLYWGSYPQKPAGYLTAEEKHSRCMRVVEALERGETEEAIRFTEVCLDELYNTSL